MPGRDEHDPRIIRILTDAIDSFEKLEVAVCLYRAHFAARTTAEVSKVTQLSTEAVADAAGELAEARVLRRSQGETAWSVDPAGPWAADLETLVARYDQDRFGLVNLMAHLAVERIRKEASRLFADAFVVKQPKKNKGDPDA